MKVIGVVSFGAGAVAVGWLGWKAYVLHSAPIVQVMASEELKSFRSTPNMRKIVPLAMRLRPLFLKMTRK